MPAKKFEAYSVSICYASVCTSLSAKEAARRLNQEHPTGTQTQWQLSDDRNFRSGEANPHPCEMYPATHKHYLFEC